MVLGEGDQEDLDRFEGAAVVLLLDEGPHDLVERVGQVLGVAAHLVVALGGRGEVAQLVVQSAQREERQVPHLAVGRGLDRDVDDLQEVLGRGVEVVEGGLEHQDRAQRVPRAAVPIAVGRDLEQVGLRLHEVALLVETLADAVGDHVAGPDPAAHDLLVVQRVEAVGLARHRVQLEQATDRVLAERVRVVVGDDVEAGFGVAEVAHHEQPLGQVPLGVAVQPGLGQRARGDEDEEALGGGLVLGQHELVDAVLEPDDGVVGADEAKPRGDLVLEERGALGHGRGGLLDRVDGRAEILSGGCERNEHGHDQGRDCSSHRAHRRCRFEGQGFTPP